MIGAGIVGAACAYYASVAGLNVTVLDRTGVSAGTTSAGEGNILVSDKEPGPELDLAVRSVVLWQQLSDDLGPHSLEMEHKGGLVVASSAEAAAALTGFADKQRAHGVDARAVDAGEARRLEPHLAPDVSAGVLYAQDMQVQPMLAAARLLEAACCTVRTGVEVTGVRRSNGRVAGVETARGTIGCDRLVNAAGPWSGEVAKRFGLDLPVLPRRGFILVTEPLPRIVHHKVYSADYVSNVTSDAEALETSTVVEGTLGGPILIGSSRERVGFDRALSVNVVRTLAAKAIRLFPVLAQVNVIRAYRGFRPYCPDHLPVVGPDPRLDGLLHASGHEGAGIGLAPATGELIAQMMTGGTPVVDARPFSPGRFVA